MTILAGKQTRTFLDFLSKYPIYLLLLILILLPFSMSYTSLATQILIYAIFASGYNILFGYTGLVSFGHAAYFGLGAYGMGLTLCHFNFSQGTALLAGVMLATLASAIFGYLSLRTRGPYFAMITLAFGQGLYFLAFHSYKFTGGDDGLRNIPMLDFRMLGISVSPVKPLPFYYFILAITLICLVVVWRLLNSPLGRSLASIRENESRALACGINVKGVELLAFVLSGFFSGLAGALHTMFHLFVHPESLHWTTSGHAVMMTLLGGTGTFLGPIVGAGVFMFLQDRISAITESWQIFVGSLFVLCVIFFPVGIWGTISAFFRRRTAVGNNSPSGDERVRPEF
jgi:branched-chain amino acid transport system permease protein